MPVAVHLNFVPPNRDGLTKLLIYEAATSDPDDPAVLIETVTEIGDYPDYISEYTTALASSLTSWFSIRWEDAKGAQTSISERIQGSTQTLVGKLVGRVLLSNPSLREAVVVQSAEYVISTYMNTQNPYDSTLTASYRQLEGMTLITQARAEMRSLIENTVDEADFTAGLVAMKAQINTTDRVGLISELLKEGLRVLGLGIGIVAQMETLEIAQGFAVRCIPDQSRLLLVEID